MSAVEIFVEFWGTILVFVVILVAGLYLIFFIKRHGVKGLIFAGEDVEEIGVVEGGPDRPQDSITVYRLTDEDTKAQSWCLNVVTKSRKFHGTGRIAGEIPLHLYDEEMAVIIAAFARHRG